MILPSLYKPACVSDFIGHAAILAAELGRAIANSRANGRAPIKLLLNGDPGVGKSALVQYLISQLLKSNKFSVRKYSGVAFRTEECEQFEHDLHYHDLYSEYRVLWIEEADKIPALAQVRLLLILDDLPPANAVVATSNCTVDDFVKRFQTRLKLYEVEPPSQAQIHALISKWPIDSATAMDISVHCEGCVRAALLDVERALDALPIAAAA